MTEPPEIAVGHLQCEADEQLRSFTLMLLSEHAVALRCDATGQEQVIAVGMLAGPEIAEAIAKATGCLVTLDYARSRLTWSGGLRPLEIPSGPMKTRRTPPRWRRLRAS